MLYRHNVCGVLVEPRGGLSTVEDQESKRRGVVIPHWKLLHLRFGHARVSSARGTRDNLRSCVGRRAPIFRTRTALPIPAAKPAKEYYAVCNAQGLVHGRILIRVQASQDSLISTARADCESAYELQHEFMAMP